MDGRGTTGGGGAEVKDADITKSTGATTVHHQRKVHSYSQPLSTTTSSSSSSSSSRHSSFRNHSLDVDLITATATAANSNSNGGVRSYSYPHFYHPPAAPNQQNPYPSGVSRSDGSYTLERAMSEYGGTPGTLPEFTGSGGGQGIFRVPVRAAMHPARPSSLDLRPHPLRETQVGNFLRVLASTRSHLFAGSESAIRCYDLSHAFLPPYNSSSPPKRGDEGSAPFRESCRTSPTLCLAADAATGLIWSGHRDGKIRSWRMDQSQFNSGNADTNADPIRERLSWQAHRAPVLSIVITPHGDIWSGSEGGSLKAWPWESIEKSLSLPMEERHVAALSVERSYIDLRTQVTVGGVCSLPAVDIKYLLSDNSRSKVWSGGSVAFAIWDSCSRELLKVFAIDGQVETKVLEASPIQDSHVDDEVKVKLSSSSKKEKSQGGFFQRSRNALMGAADAVRRVASKGTFGEDNRRTEAMAMAMDGMIWTGCTNGSLVQWDGNGNRIQEFQHSPHSVQCICAFGTRLWVGYVNGTIQVMDLEGNLLGGWVAHSSPVIDMAVGRFSVFTLANHGGIRGWNLTSPGPIDKILRTELASKEIAYTKLEKLKILVGTWNVGQERASHDSLITWLGSAASPVGLVVVGLQEVEMGAGFLAMAAAKETVGLEGSANGQWWLDTIGKTLGEGASFERVGSRQLAGLLISAWCRKSLRPHIGDVDAAAVACGFGRAIGNKGAVGLRLRVYDRVLCFMGCHFAAHLEAVNRRNADFDHVFRTMTFSRPSSTNNNGSAGASSAIQSHRGANVAVSTSEDGKPELSEADMVVFLGDFNYRLYGISYDEARDLVSQRCFDWLREKDQLRAEMKAGKVFQGMREGQIKFPPTYKFDRHTVGLAGYDSSEKKRIPAWCDRILYRDSRSISVAECSLECPVVCSILEYGACMDVNESDHKPVRCIFNVDIAHVDELTRRQKFGEIIETNEKIRSLLEDFSNVPETILSTNNIIMQSQDTSILRITNKCEKYKAAFQIICEGQCIIKDDGSTSELCRRGAFGFPHWLRVHPAAGILKPGQILEVNVQSDEVYTHEEFVDGIPQNWWCEETKDKEVVLIVNVMGSYSTQSVIHRIHVRQSISSKTLQNDTREASRRTTPQSNHLHRSNFETLNSSPDVMRDLCHMRCP